jgi:hypothetical protein
VEEGALKVVEREEGRGQRGERGGDGGGEVERDGGDEGREEPAGRTWAGRWRRRGAVSP